MIKEKTPRLADVIGVLNQLCPPALAEEWDNVGLQVGDPGAKIDKILVCLDAEEIAIDEARRVGAQLIIAHHPVIFRPLKQLSPTDMSSRVVFRAIKNDIAIVSAHTNLDRAADGLNDWLAKKLGVENVIPLEAPAADAFYKLVINIPVGHEIEVRDAVFAAGAGQVGAYDNCSFNCHGTGTFRGDGDARPFIGSAGKFESVDEVRFETIVPKAIVSKVIAKMLQVHPYEEVAYDLIPLANTDGRTGLGRVGTLPEPVSLRRFAMQVKDQLNLSAVKLVGDLTQPLKCVAVCGGTGMSLFSAAVRHGADCFVTADIKFHEAQRARTAGVALIDAGHFATEQIMVAELSQRLRKNFSTNNYKIEVIEMAAEEDPLVVF